MSWLCILINPIDSVNLNVFLNVVEFERRWTILDSVGPNVAEQHSAP